MTTLRHGSPNRTIFADVLPASKRGDDEVSISDSLPRLAHRMGSRRLRRFCNDNFIDSCIAMDDEVRAWIAPLRTPQNNKLRLTHLSSLSPSPGRRRVHPLDASPLLPARHALLVGRGVARRDW